MNKDSFVPVSLDDLNEAIDAAERVHHNSPLVRRLKLTRDRWLIVDDFGNEPRNLKRMIERMIVRLRHYQRRLGSVI